MKTVSVIIPTHNRAIRLKEAVESVLAQTYQDWELIIVDDHSSDDTASMVEGRRFTAPYRTMKPYAEMFLCAVLIAKHGLFKAVMALLIPFLAVSETVRRRVSKTEKTAKVGYLSIEYFDQTTGGFGGYGKTAKNISSHFNPNGSQIKFDVIVTRRERNFSVRQIGGQSIILAPDPERWDTLENLRYSVFLNQRKIDFLLTTEFYPAYLRSILLLPRTPLMVWIRDPRPEEEMAKIATVQLEVAVSSANGLEGLMKSARNKREAIKRLIAMSKVFHRKIYFAASAYSLIELAKKTYGLSDIEPVFLPTPVDIPDVEEISWAHRPTFCFLGRLDPIKRPWIFFELAKRFPNIEFLVAGETHFPSIMKPVIHRYVGLSNLKFLGLVQGQAKDNLLRQTWGIVNTSVHEAVPVSFLESLSYGKPVISCQNPDNLVSNFGAYTGEILGDGFDERTVSLFSEAVHRICSDADLRREKGMAGRQFIKQRHSFENFERTLVSIICTDAGQEG
ncbi:MAG: glycosyltransferase [Candidatus Omnitrophica bacterium]|nr:glycosyltransferase [Candidatus Omnitrophota bacterium]